MRVVSLPWYDLPASRRALDAFWLTLRGVLREESVDRLPNTLDRTTPLGAQWSHPDLLLSQCCGLDLFTAATRKVTPVGRPVFSDLSCEPGHYFSYIAGARGANLSPSQPVRIAVNAPSSRSGCTALLSWLKARAWTPLEAVVSGSHQASVNLIRRGLADLAAVDAHSWGLIDQDGLEILGQTADAPTPPFITYAEGDVPNAVLLQVLQNAVLQKGREVGLSEVLPVDKEVYRPLAAEAAGLGIKSVIDRQPC